MTTKQELLDLAERVEGGLRYSPSADNAEWLSVLDGAFRPQDVTMNVIEALNGSLDAAKALHDAVLPGWVRVVDATVPSSGIEVRLFPGIGSGRGLELHARGDCENEPAAWVAAILRAKAEECEE